MRNSTPDARTGASSADRPWFQRGYRRMLVDMHIPDWDPAFLSKFDPQAMAELYTRAGLSSVMIYCQSHVGLCYWPTRSGRMHAGLRGRDVVGEQLAALHERGLAVCAYYSVIYNNWAWLEYPAWRIVTPGGTIFSEGSFLVDARYGHCCPNNPDYRAFAGRQVAEILGGYAFEGIFFDMTFWPSICLCLHCRKRFRQEAGREIPETLDWHDPSWCAFQAAREHWMAEFSEFLTRQARAARAGVSVYHNFAVSLFNWTLGLPFAAAESHDFLGADFYGDAVEQLMATKFMIGLGRRQPVEFMTSCTDNLRDHVRLKSETELRRQAFAATLFSGAFLFIDAIDPDGTPHRALADRIRAIYDETARYEPFLGGDALAEIAIYFSGDSRMDFAENGLALAAAPTWQNRYPHSDAVRGLCRLLQAAHLPFAIVTRRNLAELSRYRVVALPNVLRMNREEAEAFRRYVQAGGRLYASGQTSLTETNGNRPGDFLLADVFGCHAAGTDRCGRLCYVKPAAPPLAQAIFPQTFLSYFQPAALGKERDSGACAVPLAENPEGETLATLTLPYASAKTGTVNDQDWASIHCFPPWEDTPAPAMVRHVFGKGLSLYSAAPLETVNAEANNRLLTTLFKELLGDRPACAADAHPAVWMNVQHQPEKKRFTVAFLNQQTAEPPLPIPSLRFRLRRPEGGSFTGLTLAPGRTPVPFDIDAWGDLHAELRGLAIFEMLVAEYKKDPTAPRRQENHEN